MKRVVPIIAVGLLMLSLPAHGEIEIDGEEFEVVDPHIHSGLWGQIPNTGRDFLVPALPYTHQLYAPALFDALLNPYTEHVGIRSQTEWAGVDHAGILAVYTHHTSGYFTNAQLIETLRDSRNDGWAWGFVSVNLDDFEDQALISERADALASYFEEHSDILIGIKLAHAHQGVPFDAACMNEIYEVAAEYDAPLLLHSGFSPFPNSQTSVEYYDPFYLTEAVEAYDGQDGRPRVDFLLAHMGQGDYRSVIHTLELAESHDNVWLDLSALGRPLMIDEHGESIESDEDQYPWVLEEIRDRGLVSQALFASDGAQFSGMIAGYLGEISTGMQNAGYSHDEMRAVLSENFYRLFFE